MDKILDLLKKYSDKIMPFATAYFILLGLTNDVVLWAFAISGLGILVKLLYIAIGIVGIYKVVATYKPELIEKLSNKKK